MDDPLARPGARRVIAQLAMLAKGAGVVERLHGVADQDLEAYYEEVTGKKWEWRETNPPLPTFHGLRMLGIALRRSVKREPAKDWVCKSASSLKAKEWRGATEEKARAVGSKWLCPACGPVGDPIHGDDESMHCPELNCDEVVDAVLPEGESLSWREQGKRSFDKRLEGVAMPNWQERTCEDCQKKFTPTGRGQARRVSCYTCKPPKGGKASTPKKRKPKPKPGSRYLATPSVQVEEETAVTIHDTSNGGEEPFLRVAGNALLAVGARRASKWLGGWATRFENLTRDEIGK